MKQNNFFSIVFVLSILFFSCSKDDSSLGGSDNRSTHASGVTQVTGSTPINYATRVSIQKAAFTPAEVTVMVSGAILWVNNDDAVHTVTADDGSFDSGDLQPGASVGFTFNTPGPHPYHCKYHAEKTGLVKCVTK